MLTSPTGAAVCVFATGVVFADVVSAVGVLSATDVSVFACTVAFVSFALSVPLPPHATTLIAIAAAKDKVIRFFVFNFLILLLIKTDS